MQQICAAVAGKRNVAGDGQRVAFHEPATVLSRKVLSAEHQIGCYVLAVKVTGRIDASRPACNRDLTSHRLPV